MRPASAPGRRATPRWRPLIAPLLAAVVLIAAACGSAGDASSDRLPELELPRLGDGPALRLSDVDGPAVVNLWATWCAPCRREMPEFEAVHLERGDQVRFIGVNIGDREDAAAEFLDDVGVTFENYLDIDGELNEALRTATLPVTVVTGLDGSIVTVHSGPKDAAELIQELDRVLVPAP